MLLKSMLVQYLFRLLECKCGGKRREESTVNASISRFSRKHTFFSGSQVCAILSQFTLLEAINQLVKIKDQVSPIRQIKTLSRGDSLVFGSLDFRKKGRKMHHHAYICIDLILETGTLHALETYHFQQLKYNLD